MVGFVKLWVEQGQVEAGLQPTIVHRSDSIAPWSTLVVGRLPERVDLH